MDSISDAIRKSNSLANGLVAYIWPMQKEQQAEDAARLKRLFEAHKEITGETQDAFGRRTDIGNQSMVSQYLNNERPLNLEAAGKFSEGLECVIDDFSPTIAKQIRKLAERVGNVIPLRPGDAAPHGMLLIKVSTARLSAGGGRMNFEIAEDTQPMGYRESFLRAKGINPKNARRFPVVGDSMEPTLHDGDHILVDLAATTVIMDRVFAVRYGDALLVKRLGRRYDGALILKSDNKARYEDEVIPLNTPPEQFAIIGQVKDKSGDGGL